MSAIAPVRANSAPIEYDGQGRMKFHPDYHGRKNKDWTTVEQKFLINNYATLGPEAVSLELKRTILTVMSYACRLRKAGLMPKPAKGERHNQKRTFTAAARCGHV